MLELNILKLIFTLFIKKNQDISYQFISSYDQIVNVFTKILINSTRFCQFHNKLTVVILPISLRGDEKHQIDSSLSYLQLQLNSINKQ
jgi:hypothetical protein